MAGRTRALHVGVAAVNVVIFVLAFTSIYPFPAGDFKIDLPSPNEIQWDYDDGLVTVTAPFSIDNGGFYDVQDLSLAYTVTNYSNEMIAEDMIEVGTMKAGTVTDGEIVFEFDLLSLYESGVTWMVFNDDLLDFTVEVSCYYTMRLVKFDAVYSISIPWDALIQEADVTDVRFDVGSSELLVDYRVATSRLLSGSTIVTATLYEDGVPVSETEETVVLGTNHVSTLAMDVPDGFLPDAVYTVTLEATIGGFDVEHSIPVEVPP